jgi:hypothetical protein
MIAWFIVGFLFSAYGWYKPDEGYFFYGFGMMCVVVGNWVIGA